MRQGISQDEKYSADQSGKGEQEAMIWAPNKPHRMGNDYAHKSDKTGKANCRRGYESRSAQQDKFNPLHIDAQLLCLLFIKLHNVEGSGMEPD